MFYNYPEAISHHIALEISDEDEDKSCISESEEVIALNRHQKLSKGQINQLRKKVQHYYSNNTSTGEICDILDHQDYLGKHIRIQTVESSAQTDNMENTVAIQADIIPKISCDYIQRCQFVQTDGKYHPEDDSEYSDQDWDSNKSEYSECSSFAQTDIHPFTKVITLSSIPNTMKRQQDYVGNLEEKTYRVSRWLVANEESSNHTSEDDFASKKPHAYDLIKKVSFSSKTISPEEHLNRHFQYNAQTEYLHEDSSVDPVQNRNATKQNGCPSADCQRKDFQNRFGQNDEFLNKIDCEMLVKAEEVKRELLSKTSKALNPTKMVSNEDLKPNCYKTMNETQGNPVEEQSQFLKPEPVKVRKRFSNYLKDQYRNLSDDTMGKSYMMMQDLREVLQKRGVSN
ncbi:hypothetical protein HNY73_004802 [Argiope bruennichi]|uniref:Uncharacterized protein n=1 Tax=Argiope bruennichi TaxID=94029 RepID=A0A8T0FQ38_ARGBR|nr:hypothetical protein HNY73_004802 [Argiope bruennichi]